MFQRKVTTAEIINEFAIALEEASGEACRNAFKEFIESHDTIEEVVHRGGNPYKFKKVISKTFLTRFGEVEIDRRYYHCHSAGGPGVLPLDEQIDMQNRFVMSDVVEFLLYGVGKLIPTDLAEMFAKINHFKPSAELIHDIVNQDGQAFHNFLNSGDDGGSIRTVTPPAETPTAMVASIDGGNLHVREPGKKKGAKTKRPGKNFGDTEKDEKRSSYKNAMIGRIIANTSNSNIGRPRIGTKHLSRLSLPSWHPMTFYI